MEEQKSIVKEEWFAWLMYFLIPLFGIFLFWKNRFYPVLIRILITCLYIIPMSLIITVVVLFFTTDLSDKLNSISFPAFEEELQKNISSEQYDEDAQEYASELMYFLDDLYGGEDWYYDMKEIWVEINFVGLKETVTVKVFMDTDSKKGYEDQMYAAILEYCKEYHPITYDGYRVKIYNQNKKLIFEKDENGKQQVID